MLGLAQEEMRGLRIPEILPGPESESAERTMRRALETGEGQRLELATPMPGHPRPLAWSAVVAPLLDDEGRTAAVMLSAHDTTAQLIARQRLTLLNEASVRIGLLLVPQLTESWGTRQTATGKTIWAELAAVPALQEATA